jgi:hypothetical protein
MGKSKLGILEHFRWYDLMKYNNFNLPQHILYFDDDNNNNNAWKH